MPTKLPYPSLANPGNRLRVDYGDGGAPAEVRVMDLVDDRVRGPGARVRYEDGSEGILWDAARDHGSGPSIMVIG